MNRLIMNYLVVEGYKDAAELFSAEAGIAPPSDLGAIRDRMEIRRAVQSGQITRAIELVNELNPEVGEHAAHARAARPRPAPRPAHTRAPSPRCAGVARCADPRHGRDALLPPAAAAAY